MQLFIMSECQPGTRSAATPGEPHNRLVSEHYRSCLSRAYYAAYSKVTQTLAGTPGVSFPTGREGPNQPGETGTGGIRRLIETLTGDHNAN